MRFLSQRSILFFSGLVLAVTIAAQIAWAQTITPDKATPVAADDEKEILRQARELGLIPPGAVLPPGIDANALGNLIRLHKNLTPEAPRTLSHIISTITPTPVTISAAPTVTPSLIEQAFTRTPPTEISRTLRQFGYDLFGAPSTTFAPTDTLAVSQDYPMAPGDEIIIYVWGKALEQTLAAVVDREGKITLPKVGPVHVAGVRYGDLAGVIQQKLAAAYTIERVTVAVGKLHTISVMVIGEVAKPGTYVVSPFATLLNVLYEAGGPTRNGSMRKIKLSRLKEPVDLYRFLVEGNPMQDIKLQANDVIFVPPIGAVAGVTGHVKRPAIFELSGEVSAQQLIELAGGTLPGEGHRIQIERYKTAAGRTIEEIAFATAQERSQKLAALKIQDGDLLVVYPPATKRKNFVTIGGLVLHPGDYEFQPKLTLKDLIEKAGGVTPTAFLKRIELTRFLHDRPAETIRVDLQEVLTAANNVELKEFDRVRVYDYEYVIVSGMVWNPDRYQWTKGMTVKEAIEKAGGLKEGAWTQRGEIVRWRNPEDFTAMDTGVPVTLPKPKPNVSLLYQLGAKEAVRLDEVIPFNVTAALAGDKAENIILEEFDVVQIYDTADVTPDAVVSINGAVYRVGTYPLTPNMKISDLIFKAGGLRRNAQVNRVELYRTELGHQPQLFILDLEKVLDGTDKTKDIILADRDAIFIRRDVNLEQRNRITLTGEVRYPGEYIAVPGERLSSVLRRAGGFTEKSYLPAAVFKRASIQEAQKTTVQRFIQMQRESLLREETIKPLSEMTEAERKMHETSVAFRRQLLDMVAAVDYPGRMVIKLDALESFEGSRDDILIEDGDSLYIPPVPSTVQVLGSVYNSTALIYEPGKNLDYYLAKVGGPTRDADKSQIYVIKANGEVNYRFARVYPLERGDTVVVPADVRTRADWRQLMLDASKIIANLAIGAAVATR